MKILHDEKNKRFYVVIDGLESLLEYSQRNNVLDFNHTYVPIALRGKGIASELVKAALEYSKSNGFKIIPSCSYVANYFQNHPEYENLLA